MGTRLEVLTLHGFLRGSPPWEGGERSVGGVVLWRRQVEMLPYDGSPPLRDSYIVLREAGMADNMTSFLDAA